MPDTDLEQGRSLYRELASPVVVYHNSGERPFIAVPHLHSQVEIYYNIRGGQSFFVNNIFYPCGPNDLFVVPQTQIHKAVVEKNITYERCIINIDTAILSSINHLPNMHYRPLGWLNEVGKIKPHKVHLNDREHKLFLDLIKSYNKLEEGEDEIMLLIALLKILRFVGALYAKSSSADFERCTPASWSDKAISYIECNVKDKFSIKEVAQKLFVNENYLCAKFKEETDMTINRYIILRKVAEAKRLLYSGASVKEACNGAGLHDYSNFIRTFRKEEGISPSKLRKLTDPL